MSPPRKVKVGYKTYTVTTDQARVDEHGAEALHVGSTQDLVLSAFQGPDQLRLDLLHESMHACADIAQLSSEVLKKADDAEEEFILRAAPVLLGMLRDNPKLVAFLTAP